MFLSSIFVFFLWRYIQVNEIENQGVIVQEQSIFNLKCADNVWNNYKTYVLGMSKT